MLLCEYFRYFQNLSFYEEDHMALLSEKYNNENLPFGDVIWHKMNVPVWNIQKLECMPTKAIPTSKDRLDANAKRRECVTILKLINKRERKLQRCTIRSSRLNDDTVSIMAHDISNGVWSRDQFLFKSSIFVAIIVWREPLNNLRGIKSCFYYRGHVGWDKITSQEWNI